MVCRQNRSTFASAKAKKLSQSQQKEIINKKVKLKNKNKMKARITLMVAMMTIVLTAAAMPYTDARNKAMFLTDKMAYELNLTESQLEAVY